MKAAAVTVAVKGARPSSLSRVNTITQQITLVGILALMFITFFILSPKILAASNILNVLRQASSLFMLACGQTLVVLVRGLDLSQGAIVGLVSVVTAMAIIAYGPFIGILAGLLAGGVCGLLSGIWVAKARIPAFAATLGMLFVVEGVTLIITEGQPIFGIPDSLLFNYIGAGNIGPIPVPAILFALFGFFFYLLLKFTRFGRHLYAIGGNEEAARLSGIQVKKTVVIAYLVNGFLCALGSIILTSRVNSGQPLLGGSYMMESLGAVVIGGTSLFGGRGGILQSVLGVCFLAFMVNGLTILGMSTFVRQTLIGILIIASVYLSILRSKQG